VKGTKRLRIALATGNRNKVKEIRELLGTVPVILLTPAELDVRLEVTEDGTTYEENALIKARALARAGGLPAVADDSGLEVAALDGGPGLHSSRFAGEEADDAANRRLLLERLAGVPEEGRRARFVCTAVLVIPGPGTGRETICRGEWMGVITDLERGSSGFGYDPIFLIPEEGRTVAELGEAYKRRHSHRARAFGALAGHLEALARGGEPLD
jgi:XTP/dITP diphosphohydrolase